VEPVCAALEAPQPVGQPVVPSWYPERSLVLDLQGRPEPVIAHTETARSTSPSGFSYTGPGDLERGLKLGTQT
jgi:hypothetical protein